MSNPFFSVIVTEHNSAAFMEKGLDSIADQSFRDYELIVICDNCEDNTAEIAKEYDKRVPEITVVETDFGRAGLARNKGLDIAHGEWVLWMDDDDWFLHEFAFEMIADFIKEHQKAKYEFDILAYSFIWKEVGFARNTQNRVWPAIWNKAWRREFIGDARFPDWKHSDDYGFAVKVHPKARFVFWDQPFYYYNFMRAGSISEQIKNGEYDNHDIPEEYWHASDGYENALNKGINLNP